MKPAYITVPLGLLLALSGAVLFLLAKRQEAPGTLIASTEWGVLAQPRHPVTPEMWKEANSARGVLAPAFAANDSDGTMVDLAAMAREHPIFLYFVQDGCPCSIEAQPHFERLYQRFRGKVFFVAVSDADPAGAKKWKSEFSVPYSVVPMPSQEVMHLFSVKRSVYSLLIGKGQAIIRMWPGYSADMLKSLNQEMAQAVGEKAKDFDPKLAPIEMTSGCAFAPEVRDLEKQSAAEEIRTPDPRFRRPMLYPLSYSRKSHGSVPPLCSRS